MWAYFGDLLNSDSLSPHGICLLWRPELMWTHVVSDVVIGASYFSIPVFLGWLVWKRPDVSFNWVIWCFAIFILACGTTHFFSIWTLWYPDYGVEAIIKAVTAGASVATAALLWPLLPKALSWPSPAQLAAANGELMALVAERDAALDAFRREAAQRARAEEMLRQAQKMEALGQLTGGVAHDFNNLLTVISMNLDRIEGETKAVAEGALGRSVRHARSAAEKAASITGRMLSFARKDPLHPTRFEANATMRELEPLLRDVIRQPHTLVFDLTEEACPIFADQSQFENAILNLAINARDALGEAGEVRISVSRRSESVRIEIADDGEGMSDDVRARAFEPFFTTKGVGKGSGLGLSQVFGFVKQSHGEVSIRSEPGKGARIVMFFPARRPGMMSDVSKKRILVVEDEDLVREIVVWALEDMGFEVLDASSGDEAMAVIGKGAIDLLLTDIRMPGIVDGWTLGERARELMPDLPIIYASGFSHEPPRMATGSLFVQKPLRTETLRKAIQDMGLL